VIEFPKNFPLTELTRSAYAIRNGLNNTPPDELLENGRMLADGLERVRALLSVPIYVESGYRSPRVNRAVGGTPTSQHKDFLAADIVPIGYGLGLAMKAIIAAKDVIQYDQLIYEGGWIHVSFSSVPRGDTLLAKFANGKVFYSTWA
jgi:hypothetical protein